MAKVSPEWSLTSTRCPDLFPFAYPDIVAPPDVPARLWIAICGGSKRATMNTYKLSTLFLCHSKNTLSNAGYGRSCGALLHSHLFSRGFLFLCAHRSASLILCSSFGTRSFSAFLQLLSSSTALAAKRAASPLHIRTTSETTWVSNTKATSFLSQRASRPRKHCLREWGCKAPRVSTD